MNILIYETNILFLITLHYIDWGWLYMEYVF